jgi:GxxExxY protein
MKNDGHRRDLPFQGELRHARLTHAIIGAFYRVHRDLGAGFAESVYGNALAIELTEAGLSFEREAPLEVHFRGHTVGQFRADFLVESVVLLEIKAATSISDQHCAQVINYLRCTDVELALLLCFADRPRLRRFLLDNHRKTR